MVVHDMSPCEGVCQAKDRRTARFVLLKHIQGQGGKFLTTVRLWDLRCELSWREAYRARVKRM